MDRLKGFVIGGMGLVVVLGKDTPAASLAALTNEAIQEGNSVEAAEGPYHSAEAEKLGAVMEYVGPRNDPLRNNISWKSAVRVFERWILNVNRGDVIVATSDKDPVHPHTPILVRLELGRGTIYVLNVWMTEGNQAERMHSYAALLAGVAGRAQLRFSALAVLQLAALRSHSNVGAYHAGSVQKVDSGAGSAWIADTDPRDDFHVAVRDLRNRA